MNYWFYKFLLAIYLLILANPNYAQQDKTSNLLRALLALEGNIEYNEKLLSQEDQTYVNEIKTAVELDQAGDSDNALQQYQKLLKGDEHTVTPKSLFPILKIGYLHTYSGEYDKAEPIIQILSEALSNSEYNVMFGNIQDLMFRYYYAVGETKNSDDALDESILEFRKSGQYRALVVAMNNKANFTMDYNVDEALVIIDESIKIAEKQKLKGSLGFCYSTKGAVLKIKGDYDESVNYLYKSLRISEELRDTFDIANTLMLIAATQLDQEQNKDAIASLQKARDLCVKKEIMDLVATSYYYESYAYFNTENYEQVVSVCKLGLKASNGQFVDDEVLLQIQLAEAYSFLGHLDSAYLAILEMEKVNIRKDENFTLRGQGILAKYYLSKGMYEKAKTSAERALAFSKESGILAIELENYAQLVMIEKEMGNYQSALQYLEKANKLEKELVNEQNLTDITEAKMESEFEIERKITLLQNEKEKAKLNARKQLYLSILSLALLSLAALTFIFFLVRKKNYKINEQNNKLVQLNKTKDTLFQIIGHDLKKPTINFRSISKNISYLLAKQDYKRLQLLGEEIDQDAKSLYNLTDNLLNWALMQKDTISINPQKVNVHQIVNYNFDIFETLSKRKEITLENKVDKDVSALVDRNSLDTIIRNLIDNAIKYTPHGGLISLTCKITDGLARISITDTGMGMTQEKIDEIYNDQSVKSIQGTRGEKGSGIGLRLIKNLIKKNRGKLEILSKQGNGSTIILNLPLATT